MVLMSKDNMEEREARKYRTVGDEDFSTLDPGIKPWVEMLWAEGVETFESCQGGDGHAFLEPTIRFHGETGEGHRALGLALGMGLPVAELRREWPVQDGEPTGPWWSLTFATPSNLSQGEPK